MKDKRKVCHTSVLVTLHDVCAGNISFMTFDGAFIAVGHTPNSDFLGGLVSCGTLVNIRIVGGKMTIE